MIFSAAELSSFRAQFPVTRRFAYLNHAGVCPTSLRVAEATRAAIDEGVERGILAYVPFEVAADQVRRNIARLIGAEPEEIAFTRSTSHGLSLIAAGLNWKEGDNVLCAVDEEYPSNVYPWQQLAARGVSVRAVHAVGSRLSVDAFAQAGDARTRLVTVSSVQYASGFRIDLDALGALCADRGWLLCVDGIQSVGILPTSVKRSGIHFLAADSHKWMLGLLGMGFLYVARELCPQITPALIGWKSMREGWNFDRARLELRDDALRFEEGSMPYPAILGMGAGVEMLLEVGVHRVRDHVMDLNAWFAEQLLEKGHRILTPLEPDHRGGALAFSTRHIDPNTAARRLQEADVVVTCRRNHLRVSPHFYNTRDDLQRVLHVLRMVDKA